MVDFSFDLGNMPLLVWFFIIELSLFLIGKFLNLPILYWIGLIGLVIIGGGLALALFSEIFN